MRKNKPDKIFIVLFTILMVCISIFVYIAIYYNCTEEGKVAAAEAIAQEQKEQAEYEYKHTYDVHNIKEYVVTEEQTNNFGGVIRTEYHTLYSFEYDGKIYKDFDPDVYNKNVKIGEKSVIIFSQNGDETLIISNEDFQNR